jgi:hypothetical protein
MQPLQSLPPYHVQIHISTLEKAVLGIRDILVRIRICISVSLTNVRIRLLSLVTLRMPKNFFFHSFFITDPQAHIFSLKNVIFC